jgi:hypothetical protein
MHSVVDMPESQIELLHRFLRQGQGKLSKRASSKEFAALNPDEVDRIEELYSKCFLESEIPDAS